MASVRLDAVIAGVDLAVDRSNHLLAEGGAKGECRMGAMRQSMLDLRGGIEEIQVVLPLV